MKIAFDAKRYYHNHTGLGNYSRTLVTALLQQFPENEYVLYDEKFLTRTFKMGRKAQNDGCQVLHGLSNELPLDSRKTGIKTVVTIHDVAWRTFPDMYHFIDRQLYDMKYGWAARNADVVVAISESTKQDVMRFYNVPEEHIEVIYQPVTELFYTPLERTEARKLLDASVPNLPQEYLLSVGSINSRKNLLGALQALARIDAENRPPLVVVGRGREYMRECQQFASQHLRQSDIIWFNHLDDLALLQALYTHAMALLYPSHYEGFGLPVVESLLQGTPVLTSTVSSLPEAAGPGGLLVNPTDIDEMTSQLKRLIDDEALRHRLATEGEAYCRSHFTTQGMAEQMMNVYRDASEFL